MLENIDRNSSVLELDGLPEEICEQLRHVSPHHLEKLLRAMPQARGAHAILLRNRGSDSFKPSTGNIPAKKGTTYVLPNSSAAVYCGCKRG